MLVKPHKRQCKQSVQTGWKYGENMGENEGYGGGDSAAVKGREDSKQILVGFLLSQRLLDLPRLSLQLDWSREELPADEPRTERKGVLGPWSKPGSFLATWNPHSFSVVLLIASATWTPKDHLRFLNLHKHLFGTCSETTLFWMVCLSLMTQYPSLD